MLKQLKISNFRLFDDEVTVRFRPITVFIGRNNAGNSSIIKFLLMLQQSSNPGNSEFLASEGERVKLGTFPELKNSLTKNRHLRFRLESSANIQSALSKYLSPFDEIHDKNGQPDSSEKIYSVEATVSYDQDGQSGKGSKTKLDMFIKGENVFTFSEEITKNKIFLMPPEILQDGHTFTIPGLPSGGKFRELSEFKKYLSEISAKNESLGALRYAVNSICHLSSVREESKRVIIASPPPKNDVGQIGQYTLPHLQKLINEDEERYKFIHPHMETVMGITDIRFLSAERGPQVAHCIAKNMATDADTYMSDFGFGVSQCLPIFVQGAITPPETFMMVEQPEAHIHPTAQLEIGGFFAELWKKRKVGSIIETHSGNIILRLQRLINKKELDAKDVSIAFFDIEGKKAIVKNLDIEEDGSLQDGLPMEFFHQDIWEAIELDSEE